MTGTGAPRRLRKRDVEQLLATYDSDPVAALSTALRTLLDMPLDTRIDDFDGLIFRRRDDGKVSPARARALLDRDLVALDELARDLNESRVLPS
jgi:hypothetical protein